MEAAAGTPAVSDTADGSGCSASGAETESLSDGDIGWDGDGDGAADEASIQLDMPRRSMQLTFTCGKCGE